VALSPRLASPKRQAEVVLKKHVGEARPMPDHDMELSAVDLTFASELPRVL